MKKEIPILFQGPMVKAIFEGKKSMTRRVITPQPIVDEQSGYVHHGKHLNIYKNDSHHVPWQEGFIRDWSRWKPGDLLYVRESWTQNGLGYFRYKADYEPGEGLFTGRSVPIKYRGKWKPSIHMPKVATRIWLEVVSVHIERLHDITEKDIISEGVRIPVNKGNICFKIGEDHTAWDFLPNIPSTEWTSKQLFFAHWAELWCKVNGRENWNANPWVWVIEFKNLTKNKAKP